VPPFEPRHSPLELLEIVRAVSLYVDPDQPATVSGRRWDAGRSSAGHADAPRAFSIAKRLGVSWPALLRVAHLEPDLAWRRLANLQADKGRKGVTLDGVFIALRQAALRLGAPSVDRTDYKAAREGLVAASRRTRRGRAVERAVPELTQIEEVLRRNGLSWEQALEQAGLAPPESKRRRGVEFEQLARAFIDQFGRLPRNYVQLRRWAEATGTSFPAPRKGQAEQARLAIAAVLDGRWRAGLPDLPIASADLTFENTGPRLGTPARIKQWDRERLIAGMALAVELLGPGQQLDQRSLKRIAADRRDLPIPSYSTVNRHLRKHHPNETWEQWRREAMTRARTPRPANR
jgi:hypothetical protein